MSKINRRTAIASAFASGAALVAAEATSESLASENGTSRANGLANESMVFTSQEEESLTKDQSYVVAAGMTPEEAKCWSLVAEAAGAFFNLPEQHPLDKAEVVTAVHVIQNKLLSRPTYRKYIKLAKAGHEAEQKAKENADNGKQN